MKLPDKLEEYIYRKVTLNGAGGRPHFLTILGKEGRDVKEELLNIVELAWIKNRSMRSIARKYKTGYDTIRRLLLDLEELDVKEEVVRFLMETPRRKRFFNRELETSDYDTVSVYIRRAKRDQLKNWRRTIINAERAWKALNYKNPENWTAEELLEYFATLSPVMQSTMLDAVRMVAPQIKDEKSDHYIKTGRFREKIPRRKKNIFGKEVKMIVEALKAKKLFEEEVIWKLHVSVAAREGTKDDESGICGIGWDRFKRNFRFVDDYEAKVRGGIMWADCPVDLFWKDLPQQLKKMWIDRGKPMTDKVVRGGYYPPTQEGTLSSIYANIRAALKEYWEGKVDPSLLKEFVTLKPHDSDKIHVNMLWEAEVPLEVVAGLYLGQGQGVGLVGRGWLDINTIKKYYLSLTRGSKRFKKIERKINKYASQFN